MSVLLKVASRTQQLLFHPETPFPQWWSCQQQRQRSAFMDLDVVFVTAASESNRRGYNIVFAAGADIGVATFQHQRQKPPGMIVEEAFVITTMPVVQPDGKQPAVQHPAMHVRASLQPQRLIPSQLKCC